MPKSSSIAPHSEAWLLQALLGEVQSDGLCQAIRELTADRARHEPLVRELATSEHPLVRARAQAILRAWGIETRSEESVHVGPGFLQRWEDLENFCWALSAARDSSAAAKIESAGQMLKLWAEQAEALLLDTPDRPSEQIKVLRQVLYEEEGLQGDRQNYYDASNSYLDLAIERRRGLPLTLSLIYILVGRRVGLPVCGLNTPGHYLACLGPVVFDPFAGGLEVDLSQLLGAVRVTRKEDFVRCFYATPLGTARRMLMNLLNAYVLARDFHRQQQIGEYLSWIENLA